MQSANKFTGPCHHVPPPTAQLPVANITTPSPALQLTHRGVVTPISMPQPGPAQHKFIFNTIPTPTGSVVIEDAADQPTTSQISTVARPQESVPVITHDVIDNFVFSSCASRITSAPKRRKIYHTDNTTA